MLIGLFTNNAATRGYYMINEAELTSFMHKKKNGRELPSCPILGIAKHLTKEHKQKPRPKGGAVPSASFLGVKFGDFRMGRFCVNAKTISMNLLLLLSYKFLLLY